MMVSLAERIDTVNGVSAQDRGDGPAEKFLLELVVGSVPTRKASLVAETTVRLTIKTARRDTHTPFVYWRSQMMTWRDICQCFVDFLRAEGHKVKRPRWGRQEDAKEFQFACCVKI